MLGALVAILSLADAPLWVVIVLIIFAGVVIGFFLYAYRHFLKADNIDALRSENFSLQKLAIEKGRYGDSLTGTVEPDVIETTSVSQTSAQEDKGEPSQKSS